MKVELADGLPRLRFSRLTCVENYPRTTAGEQAEFASTTTTLEHLVIAASGAD